jgi:hypothetical protein
LAQAASVCDVVDALPAGNAAHMVTARFSCHVAAALLANS